MLYLGNPPELKEHLLMPDFKTCLAKKRYAMRNSNADYKCSKVNAVVKCDHCGTTTSSFVTTHKYQHFCRIQTPGFPADKDCMTDYFGAKNN